MIKQYSIGRGDDCQIKIQDNSQKVSRNHATIKILGNGKIFITDHSSNGTFVNGVKISPSVDYPIKRGDDISFAHVANLNWELIPRTRNKMIYYIAVAILVILLAIVLCFFIGKPKPNPSIDYIKKQDSVKVENTDSIKQNSKNATNDSVSIDKKEKRKEGNSEETNKTKTKTKSKSEAKSPKLKNAKPARTDSTKKILITN